MEIFIVDDRRIAETFESDDCFLGQFHNSLFVDIYRADAMMYDIISLEINRKDQKSHRHTDQAAGTVAIRETLPPAHRPPVCGLGLRCDIASAL